MKNVKAKYDVKKDETAVARNGADTVNGSNPNSSPFARLNEIRALSRARERDALTPKQRTEFGSLVQFVMGADKDLTAQCHDWAMDKTNSYCIHWFEACSYHCAPALFAFFEPNELTAHNKFIQYILSVTYYNQHPIELLNKYMRRQLKKAAQYQLNLKDNEND